MSEVAKGVNCDTKDGCGIRRLHSRPSTVTPQTKAGPIRVYRHACETDYPIDLPVLKGCISDVSVFLLDFPS